MENGFKRIKKIAKRVLPQTIDTRMSSTSANTNSIVAPMGNDVLSEFVVSSSMKRSPGIDELITENNFECQFFDSDEDDDECSDLEHFQDSENVIEASTSFLSSMKDLEGIDPETRARLQVLFEAAGLVKTNSVDGSLVANQKMVRKLTSSVSGALDEAASALMKMKEEQTLERDEDLSPSRPDRNTEAVAQQLLKQHRSSLSKTTEDGESLLSMAASSGYYELCQVLLATNTNVDDRGSKGDCTPLMEAAAGGFIDIIQLLLHNKACINAKSTAGNTALHYAASGGHKKAVQILINAGAHVEAANENGHTPLMEAASVGHVGVAKLLIENGAEVNTQSREFKESALTLACYKGHTEMVQFLLNAGADLEHKTDEMHTALMEACIDGFVEVAKLLIDRGAEINMIPESYESPLTLAACGGHAELAGLLISKGAIVDQRNDEGYTPLMEAAREGHIEVSALLIEHGANVNAITQESKETALTLGCCGGFLEMADLLLRRGADLELGGLSPLIEASQEGHLYLVKYLLNIGANVNAVSQRGDTALSCACGNGHTAVAEVLLKAGSNLEHESNNGRTPLMKAAKMGHLLTVQYLISLGSSVNKTTPSNEYTALSLACIGGHLKVVDLLLHSGADAAHKLKDGSTMLIEASKGGHAQIVSLLLDWSMMLSSNPSFHDKSKTDTWRISAKEKALNKNHIKKTLSQLEGSTGHLGCADEDEEVECQEKTSGSTATDRTYVGADDDKSPRTGEESNSLLSSQSKSSSGRFREIESCKIKMFPKDFELKEVRHDGDGCSGGIDSAVHDLSGSSSASSSSSSSSSSSASEVEKFEDACFCCCTSEKPEASIERGENIANLVESRKRACLDHFETDSAFSIKLERSVANASSPPCSSHSPASCEVSPHNLMQNRIIAKGHRKLPQQPKAITPQQGCQSLLLPAFPFETQKSLLKHKQVIPPEVATGDAPNTSKSQNHQGTGSGSCNTLKNQQNQDIVQKTKNLQQSHSKVKSQIGSKLVDKVTCNPLTANLPKLVTTGLKNSNCLEKTKTSNGKVVGNQNGNTSAKNAPTDKSKSSSPVKEHSVFPAIEVNAQTEANHDTALTLASAGGHSELVQLLLKRGADVEHRDKKGFTSLILAAAAGHLHVVNVLLEHGADTEAQLEQTKDTALSLACSGGRHDIAEALLKHGANREHRNASDYTPLCLAASAGQVNIVRLLLIHGAEINSRTSSRLGISPLMLASMNGHEAVVRLLLDMGGDVNAQIETNKNTALTLACFQGKHEVVALLADRKANLEHRAKKGLTPLMEAAGGGYVDVGRVLLDRGADVSALHGSSTKDTALTIAADKGHYRFVELLLSKGAPVDVRNKKGYTALWLACNGGHLEVIQLLMRHKADPDSCDNRRTSCLMAAFKKGHVKVVRWLVRRVTQLPSDQECARCLSQIGTDKDLLKKCQQCMEIIINAKEHQAAEANKHANNLLLELALEQSLVESKKAAAVRKREKRKQKKKGAKRGSSESSCKHSDELKILQENVEMAGSDEHVACDETVDNPTMWDSHQVFSEGSKAVEKNAFVSNRPQLDVKLTFNDPRSDSCSPNSFRDRKMSCSESKLVESIAKPTNKNLSENMSLNVSRGIGSTDAGLSFTSGISDLDDFSLGTEMFKLSIKSGNLDKSNKASKPAAETSGNKPLRPHKTGTKAKPSGTQVFKIKDDDWKEVSRRCKKLNVAGKYISRIIGRGGCNINAIREVSGAHIDLDKMKHCDDGVITIKGSHEATQLAMKLFESLIVDPDKDIEQIVPYYKLDGLKGNKQVGMTSCSEAPKEIAKCSGLTIAPGEISVGKSLLRAITTSRLPESEADKTSHFILLKSQSFSDNNSNANGPWNATKCDSSKYRVEVPSPEIPETNKDYFISKDNIANISNSLDSLNLGQHSDEGFKAIASQCEKSISNASPASYNLIGGGEFSPFDNLLSKITETILQKNKEHKKDFASVAASCLSNGPSALPCASLSVSSKPTAPGVVDSELQAKAPGFRRGSHLQKSVHNAAPVVPNVEIPSCSGGLVARRLDFRNNTTDDRTSPVSSLPMGDSRGNIAFSPGVIGSGIHCCPSNPSKNIYDESGTKFSAALGSNLNPNAPNFTSVIAMKNYDHHSFSFTPLSQPFALSVSMNRPVSTSNAFDSPIGKERFSLTRPTCNDQLPSFMFDYGPANQLWKFDSSKSAAIHNGSSDLLSNPIKTGPSHFSLRPPASGYISESSFKTDEHLCAAKESHIFQDGFQSSFDGSEFIDGIFSSHLDMANTFVPPSYPTFSEAAYTQQNTADQLPPFGILPSRPTCMYRSPSVTGTGHSPKPSFGMPSLHPYNDPMLHVWQQQQQQLNS